MSRPKRRTFDEYKLDVQRIIDLARIERSFFKRIGMHIELWLFRKARNKKK